MENKLLKKYGRTDINKLDWILAIIACLVAIDSLWISLGISIVNAGEYTIEGFLIFLRGLSFQWNASQGAANGFAVCVTLLFYIPLLILGGGLFYLFKINAKERIPGLIAQFIGFLGIAVLLPIAFNFIDGTGKGFLNAFWPWSLIVLLCITALCSLVTTYITLNKNINIKMKDDDNEDDLDDDFLDNEYLDDYGEYGDSDDLDQVDLGEKAENEAEKIEEAKEEALTNAPVTEEEVEEEEETEEPAVVEAKEDEKEAETVEAAPIEGVNEEEEEPASIEEETKEEENPEEEGSKFDGLGPRRKRIPFENKIKTARPETRARYRTITTALKFYQFNDRKSIPCEIFSYKKKKMIVLTFAGRTLKVYFRLNPADYADSTIPVEDASEIVKYKETPALLVVKSDLAARRVIKLAEDLIGKFNIPAA